MTYLICSHCFLFHDSTDSFSKSNVDQIADALADNSSNTEEWVDERDLVISTEKSTITLFTPQFTQSNTHPQVILNNSILTLERILCTLRVE